MPAPFGPARSYEEMEGRKEHLKGLSEEELRRMLTQCEEGSASERANYEAMCNSGSWFARLFRNNPRMCETPMGRTIDECLNASSYIRDELRRRGVKLDETERQR